MLKLNLVRLSKENYVLLIKLILNFNSVKGVHKIIMEINCATDSDNILNWCSCIINISIRRKVRKMFELYEL